MSDRPVIAVFRTGGMPDDLAAKIRSLGCAPHLENILTVQRIGADVTDIPDKAALIFTSANAVDVFSKSYLPRHHLVYAVGPQTTEAARQLGYANVTDAGGDAHNLARHLRSVAADGFTYVRGNDVSVDIGAILKDAGIVLKEKIVYETLAVETLSEDFLSALKTGRLKALMFFSKKGAKTFVSLAAKARIGGALAETKALSISAGVLQSLSVLPFREIAVAHAPDRQGMMRLLDDLSAGQDRRDL